MDVYQTVVVQCGGSVVIGHLHAFAQLQVPVYLCRALRVSACVLLKAKAYVTSKQTNCGISCICHEATLIFLIQSVKGRFDSLLHA
jgi:hypothetical protein